MKILIVHNNYGKYSGEEAVVDKMADMLTSHGHEVAFYRRTTEGGKRIGRWEDKGILVGNLFTVRSARYAGCLATGTSRCGECAQSVSVY